MRTADAIRWSGMALCVLLLTGCQHGRRPLDRGAAISDEVARHAAALREAERVEGAFVGVEGAASKGYAVYGELHRAAGKEELVCLLDDRSPVVRVYAFWGLRSKFPQANWFDHLMRCLTDAQRVWYVECGIGREMPVGDLLLETARQDLDETQLRKIEDWLIENPNDLDARAELLKTMSPKPKYHALIRRLAKAGAEGSLQALAAFRDPADVPIIARQLKADNADALLAAERFPHAELFPSLVALHKVFLDMSDGCYKSEMRYYYRAVAAFRSPQAAKLLASVIEIPETERLREYPIRYAYKAVIAYRKDYPELLMRFFEYQPLPHLELSGPYSGPPDGPFQEDHVLRRLLKHDRRRLLGAIRAHFVQEAFFVHSKLGLGAMARALLSEMKPDGAFKVINEGLARADCHQLPALCRYVWRHKPDSSVPILLKLLVSTDHPSIQVEAVSTLLAYDRQDIRDKIRDLLRQGKVPKNDWGRDAVERRLKEWEKQSLQGESGSRQSDQNSITTVSNGRLRRR